MTGEQVVNSSETPINPDLIAQASADTGLDPGHRAVELLASSRQRLNSEIECNEDLEQRLYIAQHDYMTGFWLRGPGLDQAEQIISQVENNLAGLIELDEDSPTAILALGIDLDDLHGTNNRRGHEAGDKRITDATLDVRIATEATAKLVKGITRSRNRRRDVGLIEQPGDIVDLREHEPEEESNQRPLDILIRMGGDEFFILMPFPETESNTRENMEQTLIDRLNAQIDNDPLKSRLNYKIGFFEPGFGKTPQDLWNEVDPKAGMSALEKFLRRTRKFGHTILGNV